MNARKTFAGIGDAILAVVGAEEQKAMLRHHVISDGLLNELGDIVSQAYQYDNPEVIGGIIAQAETRQEALQARAVVGAWIIAEAKRELGLLPAAESLSTTEPEGDATPTEPDASGATGKSAEHSIDPLFGDPETQSESE